MAHATAPFPVPAAGGPFALWAPHAQEVEIRLGSEIHPLEPADDPGWWTLPGVAAAAGQEYAYRLDGGDLWLPDPRSRLQPHGVHGPSAVVDMASIEECVGHGDWKGRELSGRVIYEMHVGTFTEGGTFDTAIERLDHLVELGIDAVEVLPVAAFPGDRGWGYDGVGMYSVHAAYGGPEAFARFIRASHDHGLAVILDVVHNHLGPAGNYLGHFGPYFTSAHHTPWGPAVNLDQDGADQVRAFILDSVRQWLMEYRVDGLRLDAVHELADDSPRHLLAEMSDEVAEMSAESGRPLALIAESDRNDPATVTPTSAGGLGMTMQWADDIHHAVHSWITGEGHGYYGDFAPASALEKTLTRVFLHDGTFSTFRGSTWGRPVDPRSALYDGHSFVAFLQNHDQVGNRARGDRISESLTLEQQAAAISLILLGAATPMLFQGEEWGALTPFAFFTDHDEELGPHVTRGRREEFAAMGWDERTIPDPQAVRTFTDSTLDWDERARPDHAELLEWYRALLRLRREEPAVMRADLSGAHVRVLADDAVVLRRYAAADSADPRGIAVLAARAGGSEGAWPVPEGEILAHVGRLCEAPEGRALAGAGAVVVRFS